MLIDTTFARVAVRQFDHGNPLRPEEKEQRDDPQPNGDPTIGGNGRNNV
jgi:hypothetical protein